MILVVAVCGVQHPTRNHAPQLPPGEQNTSYMNSKCFCCCI